ncbi:heavy-metal-associated domain-containing protein [Flavobacterium sp. CYK-4]|uniref:heavy-metal-associated domain-containing protein n=1 Tax=Flavobacterium lotistagni TaxID=2709660 RepID=UPI001409117D|nr:heavy metal-associated domain-containing protein [Flavobacterium lotistagni]NHM07555.1 heavy-metal-associated domain-containing protein [Flavobacterium lotistagni]
MFRIEVENIKCSGCANSIQSALMKIAHVESVKVFHEQGIVVVTGDANREEILAKLKALGYPEKGNNTTFCKAKSYMSCAIGKMS